jgi:hypothetical protein
VLALQQATAALATNCTGASSNLPAAQCAAWVAFYDGAGGDSWKSTTPDSGGKPICPGTRNDPCACTGWTGNTPVCNPSGTTVVKMCVLPAAAATYASSC